MHIVFFFLACFAYLVFAWYNFLNARFTNIFFLNLLTLNSFFNTVGFLLAAVSLVASSNVYLICLSLFYLLLMASIIWLLTTFHVTARPILYPVLWNIFVSMSYYILCCNKIEYLWFGLWQPSLFNHTLEFSVQELSVKHLVWDHLNLNVPLESG